MTFVFPLVALAVAALGWFVSRGHEEPMRGRFPLSKGAALLALTLVESIVVARYGSVADRSAMQVGLFVGVSAVALGEFLGGGIAPMALGIFAVQCLRFLPPTTLPSAHMALVGALGLASLAFGRGGATLALMAAFCAAGDSLGARHSDVLGAGFVGSEVGLGATLGVLIANYIPPKLAVLKPIVIGLASISIAAFAMKTLGEGGLTVAVLLGAVAGAVIHLLFGDDDQPVDPVRIGLATIIGVGVATLAFGFGRGAGMALSLVAATGVLLGVKDRRAMLTLGPLVGLVLYRVLRETGSGATRALDIGQHYTLLALLLGIVVPLLPTDWLKREGTKAAVGTFLWGLLVLATPPLVIVMFGMRGAIGFVVGLGIAGLAQVLRGERSLAPLAVGSGMAATTILLLTPLADKVDLAREEKVRILLYAGVSILLAASFLALLSRSSKEEPAP